jgi:carbonic anhydrase/acetyltransferase-like protein (isoleucine patch superfamily)
MTNKYNDSTWIIGEPKIGVDCWIGAFTLIDGSGGLEIGDFCEISSGVHILTHSSVRKCLLGKAVAPKSDFQPTKLGRRVFVGTNAVIQMGSEIGDYSIVGAGAVVLTGSKFPERSVIVGVPAKLVGHVDKEELALGRLWIIYSTKGDN